MIDKDETGTPETVESVPSTTNSKLLIHGIVMRAWRAAHITDRRRWLGREEDPLRKLIQKAYNLGRRDERNGADTIV